MEWNYKGIALSKKHSESFWDRVDILLDSKACWYWKDGNCVSGNGYGRLNFQHHIFHSNQLAYLFTYGSIDEGKIILHSRVCIDNAEILFGDGKQSRRCCNPRHLRQGTHKENSQDTKEQGRMKGIFKKGELPSNSGDKSNFAKLNRYQAFCIKNDKRPNKEISTQFQVSVSTVTRIKAGKRWRILDALG
jgi:hypothetical protein